MSATTPPPSLNRYVKELKETARAMTVRAERAEFDLARSETALRNTDRERAREKARADEAEAALRSLGIRGAA